MSLVTSILKWRQSHFLNIEGENDPDLPDIDEQEKLVNLGCMIDELKVLVPNLLHKSLPKAILLPEVMLRLNPSHFELLNLFLPNIKGHVSYYAACKAIQLFFTSLVLNPRAQLHILSIRTSKFPEPNTMFAHSTKIIMRWKTCPEGCVHLLEKGAASERSEVEAKDSEDSFSTAQAKLGSHRWSGFDPGKVISEESLTWSVSSSLGDLTKALIGLKKEDSGLERVILGIFIFELNEDNSQVLVHTIEDMTIIERREEQSVEEKLRVC